MDALNAIDSVMSIGEHKPPEIITYRDYNATWKETWRATVQAVTDQREWNIVRLDDFGGQIETDVVTDSGFNVLRVYTQKHKYNEESPDCQEGRYHLLISVTAIADIEGVEASDDKMPVTEMGTRVNVNFKPEAKGCVDSIYDDQWESVYSNGKLEQDLLKRIAILVFTQ